MCSTLDSVCHASTDVRPDGEPHEIHKTSLLGGVLGAVLGGVVGTALWVGAALVFHVQIGPLAVLIGVFAGDLTRRLGHGTSRRFSMVGALVTMLCLIAGNLLIVVGLLSEQRDLHVLQTAATLDFTKAFTALVASFEIMDVLWYGLAISFGYERSVR